MPETIKRPKTSENISNVANNTGWEDLKNVDFTPNLETPSLQNNEKATSSPRENISTIKSFAKPEVAADQSTALSPISHYEKIITSVFEQSAHNTEPKNWLQRAKSGIKKIFSRSPSPAERQEIERELDRRQKTFTEILTDSPHQDLNSADLTTLAKFERDAIKDRDSYLAWAVEHSLSTALRNDIPLSEAVNYVDLLKEGKYSKQIKSKKSNSNRYGAEISLIKTAFFNRWLSDGGTEFIKNEFLSVVKKSDERDLHVNETILNGALQSSKGSPEGQKRLREIKEQFLPLAARVAESSPGTAILGAAATCSTTLDAVRENAKFVKQDIFPSLESITENDKNADVFAKYISKVLENPKTQPFCKKTVLPKVQKHDPLVDFLADNQFMRGENRIHDYEINCLTAEHTPRSLNHLLQKRRELPTSNVGKLEQNRIDALAIERIVIDDHSFIHNEAPDTHDLISAMIDYYDAKDSPKFENAKAQLQTIVEQCEQETSNGRGYGKLSAYVFNLDNYNRMIAGEVSDDSRTVEYHEPAIDILRRLKENTNTETLAPPTTDDPKLNQLLQKNTPHRSLEDNSMYVDWYGVGELVSYVNQYFGSSQGEYGFLPSTVDAIAYTESVATYAMRNVVESQRRELFFDPVFREIVRFNRLTASYDAYNPVEFDRFWSSFEQVSLENPEDMQRHYSKLQLQISQQLGKLSHHYKDSNEPKLAASLQSGNLSHELIGLTEKRPARTLRDRVHYHLPL